MNETLLLIAAIFVFSLCAISITLIAIMIAGLVKKSRTERTVKQILEGNITYMKKQLLTEKQIKSAEAVLSKGDRVELIPVKDGVKVIRVKREEVK